MLLRIATWALALTCGACAHAAPLPAAAMALNRQGAAALASGDLELAEARVALALEYNPRFTEAWVNLGLIEMERGAFERALADFVKARDLNPDLPAPHHALAVLSEVEGKPGEAERNYRAALKVDPGFGPARYNLANDLLRRGALEEAREEFLRLTEAAPSLAEGWSSLADTLIRLGRAEEAEAVIDRARAKVSDSGSLVILESRALLARGAFAEAEDRLEPLTRAADPKQAARAMGFLAIARLGQGDGEGASRAAERAVRIAPEDAVAKYAARMSRESEKAPR